MTDEIVDKLYFIVRTDVSEESGQQRTFFTYNDEAAAVQHAYEIKNKRMYAGEFAVFEGRCVFRTDQEVGPVKAVQVSSS